MSELGDFELQPPDSDRPGDGSRRRAGRYAAVVLLLAIAAGVGSYLYFGRSSTAQPEPVAASTEPAVTDGPAPAPSEPAVPLPDLEESDGFVRTLVAKLSSHPRLTAWLVNEGLIRTFAVAVDNIAQGRTPARHLRYLAPTERFRAVERNGATFVDPRSYARYDIIAEVFASLDTAGTARAYRTLKPLIQDAYAELGYPDADFDATLAKAMRMLLETPIVEGNVELTPKVLSHAYASERLENLESVQRQYLRMGPRNMRLVNGKLRELARELGLSATALPPEPTP